MTNENKRRITKRCSGCYYVGTFMLIFSTGSKIFCRSQWKIQGKFPELSKCLSEMPQNFFVNDKDMINVRNIKYSVSWVCGTGLFVLATMASLFFSHKNVDLRYRHLNILLFSAITCQHYILNRYDVFLAVISLSIDLITRYITCFEQRPVNDGVSS